MAASEVYRPFVPLDFQRFDLPKTANSGHRKTPPRGRGFWLSVDDYVDSIVGFIVVGFIVVGFIVVGFIVVGFDPTVLCR